MGVEVRRFSIEVVVVTALLSVCVFDVWWCLSVKKDVVQNNRGRNGHATIRSEALPKCSHLNRRYVRTDNELISGNAKRLLGNTVQREDTGFTAYSSNPDALVARQELTPENAVRQASDMNDVMDEMLNRSEIPADYAETMVALFRDRSRGDVIRDFAVQHIGLYAETLQMRGKYDADASESATLRDALWDAAEETRTIVAVAAFRALADIAAFDPHIDVSRLDSRLATCVADLTASPAARVMAAQLCGERRVVAAKPTLARIAADRSQPEPLRLAAANSARLLAE